MSDLRERDVLTWIEVRCSSGDRAECPSPESAYVAAVSLLDDAFDANPTQSFDPTVTFFVRDKVAAGPMNRGTLFAAYGKSRSRGSTIYPVVLDSN